MPFVAVASTLALSAALFLIGCDHQPADAVRGGEADAVTALAIRAEGLAQTHSPERC